MHKPSFAASRAYAEIDTAALSENFRTVSAHCTGRTLAVVKANAYGHGVSLAVPAFLRAGCDFFAVASLAEALEVRALTDRADILILGYTDPAAAPLLCRARLIQTVFSAEYAAALQASAAAGGVCVCVHIKLDSGMCRLGFSVTEPDRVLAVLRQENLRVCGVFTHFPCADTHPRETKAALGRFLACRRHLPPSLFTHAAASAAALTLPSAILDGARVGLALYGISPVQTALPLRSALRLLAPVVQIREVPRGTAIGYGGGFVTARPSRIGVIPCGYADGLTRSLSGMTVRVFCQNSAYSAPLVGRICMDQAMLDLTDTPAVTGDRVCLLSDINAAAAYRGSIPYEVLTAVSSRVERRPKGDAYDPIL